MTINEFIDKLEFKITSATIKYKNVVIGGCSRENEYLTKEDMLDLITEIDCQFGYNENNKLIDPIGNYIVDYYDVTDENLTVFIKKE